MDTIRVLRIVEISGPRDLVEKQVAQSLHGEKKLGGGLTIRASTLGSILDPMFFAEDRLTTEEGINLTYADASISERENP